VLGADGLGGFIWPEHLAAYDAIFTLLAAVQLTVAAGASLSEIRRQLPMGFHRETTVPCPWDVKGEVMRRLVEGHQGERVDLTDGLKVLFDRGYALVLPDADTPHYRVVVSGADSAEVDLQLHRFSELVQGTVQSAVR
jgi:mannose-1-phosphate guanylyltransferase/phosphomannomutase